MKVVGGGWQLYESQLQVLNEHCFHGSHMLLMLQIYDFESGNIMEGVGEAWAGGLCCQKRKFM